MPSRATIVDPSQAQGELAAALRKGDIARARQVLSAAPLPREALVELAEAQMRRRGWRDAAWLLEQVPDRDTGCEIKRRLAVNLAALQRHRPGVYEPLATLPADDRCTIAASATYRPTLIYRKADGQTGCLSASNDPIGVVH